MSGIVKAVTRAFTPSRSAARRQAASQAAELKEQQDRVAQEQRTRQEQAQARQLQSESEDRTQTTRQTARMRRPQRGRRLLLALTGEQGVNSTLGG